MEIGAKKMIKITDDQSIGLKLSYPEGAVLVPRWVAVSDPSGPGVSVDSTIFGHVFNRGSIIGAIDGVSMYSGVVANKGTISAGHDGSGVYFGQDPYWPDGTLTHAKLINRSVMQNGLYGFQFSGDSVVANIVNSGSISTRPLDPPHFRNWPPTDIKVTASGSAQVTVNNSGSMTGYEGIVITGALLNPRPYQPAVLDLSLRNSGSIVTDAATVRLSGNSVSLSLTNSGTMQSGEKVVDASADQTLSATITNRGNLSGALELSSSGSLSASVHNHGVMGSMFLSGTTGDADITNHGLMTDIRFAGISATLANFGTISGIVQVDYGASLAAQGRLGNVVDDGTITIVHDKLTVDNLSDSGMMFIGPNATLNAGSISGPGINFLAGPHEKLMLEQPDSVSSLISGFGASDTIDLLGVHAVAASFAAGVLTVTNQSAGSLALQFNGDYTMSNFVLSSDHQGGTNVTWQA
jgi:hypothetical protein